MNAIYKMSGVKPKELDTPDMPSELAHVWGYYCRLKNSGDVSYPSIKAFSELTGIELTPSEVDLIMSFDNKYLEVMS